MANTLIELVQGHGFTHFKIKYKTNINKFSFPTIGGDLDLPYPIFLLSMSRNQLLLWNSTPQLTKHLSSVDRRLYPFLSLLVRSKVCYTFLILFWYCIYRSNLKPKFYKLKHRFTFNKYKQHFLFASTLDPSICKRRNMNENRGYLVDIFEWMNPFEH